MRKIIFFSACFISTTFLGLYYTAYQSTIDVLAAYFQTPGAALGFVMSVHFIGCTLSTLITGEISERLGKKPVTLFSLIIVILGALLTYISGSIVTACVGIGLVGFGFTMLESMVTSALSDASGDKKERMLSFLHIFFGAGAVTAPMAVAYVFDFGHAWRELYLCCAIAPLLFVAAFAWSRFGAKPEHVIAGKSVTMELVRVPAYCVTLVILFFYLGVETGVGFWAKAIILEAGGAPETAATGLSVFWGAIIAGRLISGVWYKRHEMLLTASMLMGITGSAVALLMPGAYFKLAGFVLMGLGAGPVWPLVTSMALSVVPKYSGACMSTILLVCSFGGIVLPPVLSVLSEAASPTATLAVMLGYFAVMLAMRMVYSRIVKGPTFKILAEEPVQNCSQ